MENLKERAKIALDLTNLDQYHDRYNRASDIKMWQMENYNDDHGFYTTQAMAIMAGIEPEDVITTSCNMAYDGKGFKRINIEYKGKQWTDLADETGYITVEPNAIERFVRDNGIKIIGKAQSGGKKSKEWTAKFWGELCDKYNVTILNSAGNDGGGNDINTAGTNDFGEENTLTTGACYLNTSKNEYRPYGYSESGEMLDFCMLIGTNYLRMGTSFAEPSLAGFVKTLWDFTGIMSRQETKSTLKQISKDMNTEGFDWRTGWGIPIMPDINTPWVQFEINDDIILTNGIAVEIDQPAIVDEETWRTIVPVRFLAENLACDVDWDEETRTVHIDDKMLGHKIELVIDSDIMLVDGIGVKLEQPARIINERTMVPFRAVVEALEGAVAYSHEERLITAWRIGAEHRLNQG